MRPVRGVLFVANLKVAASVLGNFKQVNKEGDLRLHPIIARLVDKDTLEKIGAVPQQKNESRKA